MAHESTASYDGRMSVHQRWMIAVASTGSALDVFEFVIYGFFAQNIGRAFFARSTGIAPATPWFLVLALGEVARLGDRYARRLVFCAVNIASLVAFSAWFGMQRDDPSLPIARTRRCASLPAGSE